MYTVTISPKFQVVIPLAIRKSLRLEPGQKVQALWLRESDRVHSVEADQVDARLPEGDRYERAAVARSSVNVVDSSAWLEYFADGPNAQFFPPAIERVSRLVVEEPLGLSFVLPLASQLNQHVREGLQAGQVVTR